MMASRLTRVQRQFDRGWLVLPDARPASLSERAWTVLVWHVRDRVPYAVLAAELQVSPQRVQQQATHAAAALRYPALAHLPSNVRHALVVSGSTTRAAVAHASDAELLALAGVDAASLRRLRRAIPHSQ